MSGIRQTSLRRACLPTLSASAFAAVIGCHTPPPRDSVPQREPPPAAAAPGDATDDWRGLLVAPFGAVLKSVPIPLHEVLLFRDDAHGGSAADAAVLAPECYAADAPGPIFFGRAPEEFLLCFAHDRLSRIQASIRVPTAQASTELAAACAAWLKNAAAARSAADGRNADASGADAPAPGRLAAETADLAAPNAAACEGRDGDVHFKASLGEDPGPEDMTETESILTITLDSAPGP